MEHKYPTPIKAIIFDNDGTLLNSQWVYEWATEQLAGCEMDPDLKARLRGKPNKETCEVIKEVYGLEEDIQSIAEKRTKLTHKFWGSLELLPGAKEFVESAHAKGIPMALATSSRESVFAMKSKNLEDFYALMDHIVCGDAIKRGKPAPDIFLHAQSKWDNIKPEECVVFEDSPLGIKAANDAGMASVFIPGKISNVEEILAAENAVPTYIIPSLENFDMNLFNWAILND
jgi:pseudouridine-5'-monophosphatase